MSTYCFVAACKLAVGSASKVSFPVIVSPDKDTFLFSKLVALVSKLVDLVSKLVALVSKIVALFCKANVSDAFPKTLP